MSPPRLRDATPADLPAILELMRASLGSGMPRTERFFEWKHELNPFGRSLVLVAEDGEGLVGLRAMMRWRFLLDGQPVEAVRPVDTATHPRFRRRGLFRRLTEALLARLAGEGVQLVFNTPNDKSRPGYLKMGWREVGALPMWVRPGGRFAVRGPPPGAGTPRPTAVHDTRLSTARDPGFLRWRYAEAPQLVYASRARDGFGVFVRERERGGRRELTVCEVCVDRDPAAVLAGASELRRAVRASRADYAVAMAAPLTREAAVLTLAGFVPVGRRGPVLVARAVDGAPPPPAQLFEPEGWRVQIGDVEVF